MTGHKISAIHGQVEELGRHVASMTRQGFLGCGGQLQKDLAGMRHMAMQLKCRLMTPEVMLGYCNDALAQVKRVAELIDESEGFPDDLQLARIGLACALAGQKIERYIQLAGEVERLHLLPGPNAQEG